MTNQEFFSRSVTHVMQQKRRCTDNFVCVYAGPGGSSCAIGVHMPRELAEQADALNNSDIHTVIRDLPEAAELFKGVNVKLLDACQVAHDTHSRDEDGKRDLRNKLSEIAEEFGLEMPNV